MPYQSNNSGRAVEESYDDSTANTGRLLPGSNVNKGASNSAMGDGTTTNELISKLRFLNSGACLFVLLFHTLPIVLNPVRLTLLFSSPIRLILQAIVGILALFLFLVEARVPALGEKVVLLMRGLSVGRFQCIDLNVASGRVLALMIMGGSIGLINYLGRGVGSSPGKIGGESASDEMDSPPVNSTDSGNEDTGASDVSSTSMILIIIQCTAFSPTIWIVFALAAYTLYIMHTFPDFAGERAYSIQDESNATTSATSASAGPSWASNVGQVVQGSGYQTVGV
mmetsp:Transcript_16386/g.39214  ORF Transcript_16386/g.39214 Transcript_16386/m.39214 type:complete len:282 (+) Transcript_16386:97-942(+)|eukprot:CAMPEP_0181101900 /NCGR_PEP_ID=MMETSP1071-20121207/14015_1 /TAXON_ID=35127 /ORGANISM="Thalassiosira sp., Strain NH16" /LENGTH=281 /DNA_ID=CAMNT_0023184811 /DNA_START=66 /DNA_END=911 /DNA_ORIENTATION=-